MICAAGFAGVWVWRVCIVGGDLVHSAKLELFHDFLGLSEIGVSNRKNQW